MADVPFEDLDKVPPRGYRTPRPEGEGSPNDYSPAGKVLSANEKDLEEVRKNTPSKDPAQRALLPALEAAKGGRKRKSRKSKRKTRKSRRRYTRRR